MLSSFSFGLLLILLEKYNNNCKSKNYFLPNNLLKIVETCIFAVGTNC